MFKLKYIKLALLILVITASLFSLAIRPTYAATTITVNSTADDQDNDGECTLREAIIASNTDTASGAAAGECLAGSGTDTIEFNIAEAADFTNNGQNGYTISPGLGLPNITETVTIDGYTQPGASENTTTAPNPFDAILLIQVDGSSAAGSHGLRFNGADSSEVSGLVVSNWDLDGMALDANSVAVTGNYIGTSPAGTVAQGNGDRGLAGWGVYGSNVQIGGLLPSDRNIISGNGTVVSGGSGIGVGNNHNNWVIQGNYIGLGSDGVTEIPNAQADGSGSPSVDYVTGTLIGGSDEGAINVISGNNGHGIAPQEAPNTSIIGNYIGTDYTGTVSKPNDGGGVTFGSSPGSSVIDNIIASSGKDGVYLDTSDNSTVTGNKIGTGINGSEDLGNSQNGVAISNSSNLQIGGDSIDSGNITANNLQNGILINSSSNISIMDSTISDNNNGGISLADTSDITIQGNNIIDNGTHGITIAEDGTSELIIGGANPGQGNTISGNGGHGIESRYDPNTNQFTAIGNVITDNDELGIALTYGSPLANDAGDSDTGPNDLLNYPVNIEYEETGGNTELTYNLDVPAGNYRIEFFSNTTADPSLHGEGETFLGYQNITHTGSGSENFSHTLAGTSIPNISATATEIDGSADGFGATSEFSRIAGLAPPDIALAKTLDNPEDVIPGATLSYTLTATNVGGKSSDLTQFDGSGVSPFLSGLFIDFLPPQLTIVPGSSSNVDVDCNDITPLLDQAFFDGFLDVLLPNHLDSTAILCVYTSGSGELGSGESISTTFDVAVSEDAELEWTNHAFGSLDSLDPDSAAIFNALQASFNSGGAIDMIDALAATGANNVTSAQYPIPEETTELEVTNSSEDLSDTGRGVLPIVIVAILTIIVGSTSVIWRVK